MKKGILFRLLVIVLVCAMLFGVMGFTTTEPQDGEDGVQNEVVTEQPTGSQGEEPQGEEPGEEPEPVEDLVQVSIGKTDGGTLELVGELPENAETKDDGTVVFSVEKGTELTFVAAAAKEGVVSSEFVAAYVDDKTDEAGPVKVMDGTEADGVYTFSVTTGENPITVSAEFFGIKSVEVSNADVWVNASNKDGGKIVTVKTFGAKNVVLSADGDTITATDKGDGKFTARVAAKDYQLDEKGKDFTVEISNPDNGLKAETQVKVCKIDTVAPEVSFVSKQEKNEGRQKWSYVTWKITETGSGVVDDFIFMRWLGGNKVEADTAQETYKYDPNTGLLTFKVLAKNYNNLVVTFHDVAGNKNGAESLVKSYVEIVGVSKGHFVESDEAWWAGLGAELLFNSDKEGAMVFVGDESVAVNKESIETDEIGVRQYSANIEVPDPGKYTYTVKSKDETASDKAVINYDPTAPVISNAKFDKTYVGDNWLKNFLSDITGGWLFNNGFRFTFDVTEEDSGVYAYAYKLVNEGEEEPTAPDIRAANADETDWTFTFESDAREVVVKNTGEFTGYVYLCVWDNAENYDMVRVGVDENNDAIITNIATKNDDDTPRDSEEFNPAMTVKTSYLKDGKTADYDDEWTTGVTFELGGYVKVDEGFEVNSAAFEVTDKDSKALSGLKMGELRQVTDNEGNVIPGAYKAVATFGMEESTDVSYSGNVNFKLVCNCTKPAVYEYDETTGENVLVSAAVDKTFSSKIATVNVNVQNFIASPAVSVNGTVVANDYTSSWFNGNDNVLKSVAITAPASEAPFTTEYTLTYQAVNSNEIVTVISNDEKNTAKINTSEGGSGDLRKYFTKAGVYTLTTSTEDECGNKPDSKPVSEPTITIYYDPNPATISVKFTQQKTYSPTDNEYFDILRTAEVKITDDTFTGEEEKDSFVTITKTLGAEPDYGTWRFEANTKEGGGSWINETISYGVVSGEAKDGDHYKMTVSVTDNAGNTSRTDDQGNYYTFGSKDPETEGAYSGHKANDFTIDQTKPVVSVSFDNNNVRNGMYFNASRTATITVVEHNFDAGRVVMTATNATAGADGKTGWVQSETDSDVWTKTVTFNPQDAICEFNIKVTDLAGNVCEEAGVNYGNSAAHDKFVIDQVNPTLGVTGTNQTPYPDACTPGFTGNDTNISSANGSAEYTVQLTRTVREHKNQDVTSLFANVNPNMGADIISVVYANIPDAAENDGIYTLNVSVTDLAGNSSQTSNTFTVNRHGSFYVFNDDLAKLVNDKFVQKADGKYSITEYNASPLIAGSVKIEIYRDGQLEKTIKPTVGAAVLGASGLYEYTYDLPAENFAQDGRYSISVSSEDEAKNMSDNTKLEESILEFTVDSVNPEIVIIKGLEKAIVNAEELEFTVNAVDTYGIKSIQIVVDGEVVKTFVPQEVYDQLKAEGKAMQQYEVMDENLDFTAAYTLYESNSKQSIEIVVTDMAGNSFTTASKDFAPVYDFHDSILVSTSFFARYIHNPVALVGTGIVIAGAVWLVLAKKKKTEEAAA